MPERIRRVPQAALRLGRIGFDRVSGYIDGGIDSVRKRPELLVTHIRLTPAELAERLAATKPPLVLDVRTTGEWDDGHLSDALLVPLSRLPKSIDRLPRDQDIVCICKSGYRSSIAASILERAGFEAILDLAGGMDAWEGKSPEAETCST